MYPFFFLSSSIVPSPPRFFFIYSNVFCLCGSKNSPLLPVSFEIHYSPCSLFSLSLSLSLFVFLYSIDNRKLFSSYHHFSWDSSPISQVDTIGWERERDMYMFVWKRKQVCSIYIWNLTGRRIFSCPVGLTLASVEIRKRHWILRLIRKKWGRHTQQQKNEGRKKKGGPLDI